MIVVCGEALVDFTPSEIGGETAYVPRPGGSPRNVAVGLSRMGISCSFLGKISTDSFGDMLVNDLSDNGVDLAYLVRSDLPSTLAFVLVGDDGDGFQFYGEGNADLDLSAGEVPQRLPENIEAVHFGSYSLILGRTGSTLRGFMKRAKGQTVVSYDPNVRPSLLPHRDAYVRRVESLVPHANIVKVSQQDLSWLFLDIPAEEIVSRWLGVGPGVVVVTHGDGGATGYTHDGQAEVPGIPVDVADTVGAGDAFTSGLLARLSGQGLLSLDGMANATNDQLADAMAYANRVAALTCTRIGASPPTADELANES